jgi:dCMP deaminase
MTEWDERLYEFAAQVSRWSKDPERGVGAVLSRNKGRQVYTGYNGFPRLVADDPALLGNRDRRMELTIHAEVNAVLNSGQGLLPAYTMYVTEHPCNACALLLAQVGVLRVVCPDIRQESRWAESQALAQRTLRLAGIDLDLVDSRRLCRADMGTMPREEFDAILKAVCPVTGEPHNYWPTHGHADAYECRDCLFIPTRLAK